MTAIENDRIYFGLENVLVAETKMSHIDGERGKLTIRGYPLEEFAQRKSNEEVAYLLLNGEFPVGDEIEQFKRMMWNSREIPSATYDLIRKAASNPELHPMSALQMGISSLAIEFGEVGSKDLQRVRQVGLQIVAKVPTIIAAFWRFREGLDPIPPRNDLGHAENFLYMLNGEVPSKERSRALETYLNVVADHGFNASTFVARAIVSTNSDLISALTGAVGSLKGDKHGGAPGPALDMIFEIGDVEKTRDYVINKVKNREVIMGFGHRVYKVRDPRAEVLSNAAKVLYQDEDREFYEKVTRMEQIIMDTLEELKPGRRIKTNVEFYTALLLHGVGLKPEVFSSMFAMGRVAGWLGHILEQYENNRLIRPRAKYVGEFGKKL
ncbi:MAG: citrate synthase/methylcitrate synthase [Methanobacteriota archaeon]|nr:MAG: citrate synthase/methylcitrate synthase [Euryarchaeota archaeon]